MKPRPDTLKTITKRIKTGCGNLYVTVAEPDQDYHEIYGTLGKCGGCAGGFLEVISTLATLAINEGVEMDRIIKAMHGVRCPQDSAILPSCPTAMAKIMRERYGGED